MSNEKKARIERLEEIEENIKPPSVPTGSLFITDAEKKARIERLKEIKEERDKYKREQEEKAEKARIERLKEIEENIKPSSVPTGSLFTPDAGEPELVNSIYKDMGNLYKHEAGTGWMRAGTLLSLDPTKQMVGAGFKAIIDQNKIIIKQNELIFRELRKLNKTVKRG
jgi:hypothetical protein